MSIEKVIVIGSGPAGYAAATWLAPDWHPWSSRVDMGDALIST